jgi:7-cyano-7-deazaguanine synthase in queuosine biosynthesis
MTVLGEMLMSDSSEKVVLIPEPEKRDHYVVWSGGADSTLVLHQLIKLHYNPYNTVPSRVIHTIYLDHHQLHDTKKKQELAARKKILQKFEALGHNIRDHIVTVTTDEDTYHHRNVGDIQSYLWLTTLLPYVSKNANMYMGIIREDDAKTNIHLFKKIVRASNIILNFDVQLEFPLHYHYKHEVISELYAADLYDDVWFCETPSEDETQCGKCSPCLDHQMALVYLANESKKWAYERSIKFMQNIANKNSEQVNKMVIETLDTLDDSESSQVIQDEVVNQ